LSPRPEERNIFGQTRIVSERGLQDKSEDKSVNAEKRWKVRQMSDAMGRWWESGRTHWEFLDFRKLSEHLSLPKIRQTL
jgi:hypothetical protein